MNDQIKSGWLRTITTLAGFAVAAAGLWTANQVSMAEMRKEQEYEQRQISENKQEIGTLKSQRTNDREVVIELKGDVKSILRSIQGIERYIQRDQNRGGRQ